MRIGRSGSPPDSAIAIAAEHLVFGHGAILAIVGKGMRPPVGVVGPWRHSERINVAAQLGESLREIIERGHG